MANEHVTETCQLLSAKKLGETLSLSKRQVCRHNNSGHSPKANSGNKRSVVSDISLLQQCGCAISGFQTPKQYHFNDVQETLGTLLLGLNSSGWADEERIALLRCIDCLERRLIDIKRGKNGEQAC